MEEPLHTSTSIINLEEPDLVTFPKTRTEFTNLPVLIDGLNRQEISFWLSAIESSHPSPWSLRIKEWSNLLYDINKMAIELYETQSSFNTQIGKSQNVVEEDNCYCLLLHCHSLWNKFSNELNRILIDIGESDPDKARDLYKTPRSPDGERFIFNFCINETLNLVLLQMYQILKEMTMILAELSVI